jgi:hypothetical protein
MPALTRQDGVQFAVYTYRETLGAKNMATFRREAMMLSRENGQYARFFSLDTGEIEAVFSRDPGYLLGESIWQHFDNPYDFIYCEALPDGENAILVVIRSGSVYLDAEVPLYNLADEFISLVSGDNRYQIYIYGDIPLAEYASDEKFAFDPAMVESFTELTEPVFPTLTLYDNYKLLPLDEALADLRLPNQGLAKNIVLIIFLAIVGYVGWKMFGPKPEAPVATVAPVTAPKVTPQNPYQAYQTALATPSPSDQLMMIVANIQQLLTIPGWTPTNMNFTDNQLSFNLQTVGGTLELLLAWVKNNNITLQASTGKAVIVYPLNIASRSVPTTIYNLRDTVALLYDDINRVLPGGTVIIGSTTDQANYRQVPLTINLASVSVSMLVLLAKELQNFPVVMSSCTLTIDDGIISGNLQLQVLGS